MSNTDSSPSAPRGRGSKSRRLRADPLSTEIATGEDTAAKEVALIMQPIRYSAFYDLDPPVAVDTFMRLRNVAMMRKLFSLSKIEMAARLGIETRVLDDLISHPHLPRLESAIVDSARRLSEQATLDDVAKSAEVIVAREMLHTAINAPSNSPIKHKALEGLADRVAPKRSRSESGKGAAGRIFPPDTLELIRLGLDIGRQVAAIESGSRPPTPAIGPGDPTSTPNTPDQVSGTDVIDAEILNVPASESDDSDTDPPAEC